MIILVIMKLNVIVSIPRGIGVGGNYGFWFHLGFSEQKARYFLAVEVSLMWGYTRF